MRFYFLVVFVFLIRCEGFSQYNTIAGTVHDENNKPVYAASVHLLNTNQTALSNEDGSFVLKNVDTGTYTLAVAAINYALQEKQVVVTEKKFSVNIQLQPDTKRLDDVMVTAEKRETNSQQLPVSITALSARQITEYRLWNSNALTAIVPSLYSDNPGDGRNVTSMRGIVTTSYDPAVATYIDGVNQFSLDTYIGTLTDVERIEVLRGPQGTLYGRNAMGGVINIITKQPTNKTEAFAELNVGNHGLQRYNAGFRVPLINNKLYFGVTGLYNAQNGFYRNDFTGKKYDNQHLFYGNYFLKYVPADKWMITANIKHQENRNNGTFPLVLSKEEAFANPYHLSQNATATMIDNLFNASMVVNHAGIGINFNSISSYQSNSRIYNAPLDGDFSPLDVVSIINNYGKPYNAVKVFTQELRVTSGDAKRKLQYTAGVYVFYQNNPVKQGTYYGEFANAAYHLHDSLFTIINTSKSIGIGTAFYGQLQYQITAKLKLTGGIRYDYEHRKLSVESEYEKGDFTVAIPPDSSAKAHFDAVSPKLSLQYSFSQNNNVYLTYSRGYRVGGLSPLPPDPSGPVALSSYSPENSNNYEVGSKNVFFENKLRVNLAAYITYVNNAQVPTLVLPDAITLIRNTGKLQTKGIEAELEAVPAKGLTIVYNGGIIQTKYKSLKISQGGESINLDGKKQIYTPAATSALAVQYGAFIGKQTKFLIRGEWQYRGKMYFDFANSLSQNDYTIFHARAGIETKYVGIYVWCRNITNTRYISYAYDFGAVHLGDPRTFGVTVSGRL